jgi:HAD superfamily hydrolase (TIGR01450 family)
MSGAVQGWAGGLAATGGPLRAEYDLALLDLDGVVYIGPDAVPGAAEALDAVREAGLRVRFVTNNASRPPEAVADHLTELGVPARPAEVVTSAQVAAALLAHRLPAGAGVLVIGGAGLREALKQEGLVPMESVDEGPVAVVQGFGPEVGWKRLAEASRAVRAGLFWMATNLDLTVPTMNGPAPGNGALVRAVETAAGRGPDDVAGKPQPGAFLEAVRQAGSTRPLVVGDRLDTDLEGARAAGMPGLLVLTGITDVTALLGAPPRVRPTYVGRNLASLLETHPAATAALTGDGSAAEGRCRAAHVRAEIAGNEIAGSQVVVRVTSAGDDPVDLLRAAAVATWRVRDALGASESSGATAVDASAVIAAVHAAEPEAAWAR